MREEKGRGGGQGCGGEGGSREAAEATEEKKKQQASRVFRQKPKCRPRLSCRLKYSIIRSHAPTHRLDASRRHLDWALSERVGEGEQ